MARTSLGRIHILLIGHHAVAIGTEASYDHGRKRVYPKRNRALVAHFAPGGSNVRSARAYPSVPDRLDGVTPTTVQMPKSKRVFLSAEWRDLVMLNYQVEPALLRRYVPSGTTLDSFDGRTYVSLVGFRFCRTKLLGRFSVPFHTDFEEVNLRIYVRRKDGGDDRRGVVFISEIVPRRTIATTARLIYGENYKRFPMRHRIEKGHSNMRVEYQWQTGDHWCSLSARTIGAPAHPQQGSLEQFITEHYWGYSAQRNGGCVEYRVSHVPWQVWETTDAGFKGEPSALYGSELAALLKRRPDSAFVADGSPVIVFAGTRVQ